MNWIYAKLANILLSQILGGKKTLVLGWLLTIIGGWNVVITPEMLDKLCTVTHLCLSTNPTWGWITMAIGELTKLLRFATGQDYGDKRFIQ